MSRVPGKASVEDSHAIRKMQRWQLAAELCQFWCGSGGGAKTLKSNPLEASFGMGLRGWHGLTNR